MQHGTRRNRRLRCVKSLGRVRRDAEYPALPFPEIGREGEAMTALLRSLHPRGTFHVAGLAPTGGKPASAATARDGLKRRSREAAKSRAKERGSRRRRTWDGGLAGRRDDRPGGRSRGRINRRQKKGPRRSGLGISGGCCVLSLCVARCGGTPAHRTTRVSRGRERGPPLEHAEQAQNGTSKARPQAPSAGPRDIPGKKLCVRQGEACAPAIAELPQPGPGGVRAGDRV